MGHTITWSESDMHPVDAAKSVNQTAQSVCTSNVTSLSCLKVPCHDEGTAPLRHRDRLVLTLASYVQPTSSMALATAMRSCCVLVEPLLPAFIGRQRAAPPHKGAAAARYNICAAAAAVLDIIVTATLHGGQIVHIRSRRPQQALASTGSSWVAAQLQHACGRVC